MVFNPVQPTGAGLGWERGMDRGADEAGLPVQAGEIGSESLHSMFPMFSCWKALIYAWVFHRKATDSHDYSWIMAFIMDYI